MVLNLLWRRMDRHRLMLKVDLLGVVEFYLLLLRRFKLLECIMLFLISFQIIVRLLLLLLIVIFRLFLLLLIVLEVMKSRHIDHLNPKPALFAELLLLLDQIFVQLFFLLPLFTFFL